MSTEPDRIRKSREYIAKKREMAKTTAASLDVENIRLQARKAAEEHAEYVKTFREDISTRLQSRHENNKSKLNETREDLHKTLKSHMNHLDSSIHTERVTAQQKSMPSPQKKSMKMSQSNGGFSSDNLDETEGNAMVMTSQRSMALTLSSIAEQTDRNLNKKVLTLTSLVSKRKEDLANWRLQVKQQEKEMNEARNMELLNRVEAQREGTRKSESQHEMETRIKNGARLLNFQEATERKKILHEENSIAVLMFARMKIKLRKTREAQQTAVSTEALRLSVQMRKYALQKKQMILVEDMLESEQKKAAQYESNKAKLKKEEEEAKLAIQKEQAEYREKCKREEEEKRQQKLREENMMAELQEERRMELQQLSRQKRMAHKAKCETSTGLLQSRIETVLEAQKLILHDERKIWDEQVEAVRKHHAETKQHQEEHEHTVRTKKVARHRERYEETYGESSAFSDTVRAREQQSQIKRLQAINEHKAEQEKQKIRAMNNKLSRALEVKEDSLFAQEINEINRIKDLENKAKRVQEMRNSRLETHSPVFSTPIREKALLTPLPQTAKTPSPTRTTKSSNLTQNASSATFATTLSTISNAEDPLKRPHVACYVHWEQAMPRRDPHAKTFCYPTPTMMADPNINPVIKEKAERMLELMRELYPAEAKMATSKMKGSNISAHLLRSSDEQEVLREEMRRKNIIKTIHDDSEPVAHTSKRLYDQEKMTGVHIPPPPKKSKPPPASSKAAKAFTERFYESQVKEIEKKHQLLGAKYDVIPRIEHKVESVADVVTRLHGDTANRKKSREAALETIEKDTVKTKHLTPGEMSALNQKLFYHEVSHEEKVSEELAEKYVHEVVSPRISKERLAESVERLTAKKKQ